MGEVVRRFKRVCVSESSPATPFPIWGRITLSRECLPEQTLQLGETGLWKPTEHRTIGQRDDFYCDFGLPTRPGSP